MHVEVLHQIRTCCSLVYLAYGSRAPLEQVAELCNPLHGQKKRKRNYND